MMTELLDIETIDAFKAKAAVAPHRRELLVDLLLAIQARGGWVPDEAVELASEILGLSPLQVEEVATFYDKIYRQPVGKRVIHICDSICCWSRGGEELFGVLQKRLGIGPGETTPDGIFTLLPTCCLGACGQAPAMTVGRRLYGDLTEKRIDEILETERAEAIR